MNTNLLTNYYELHAARMHTFVFIRAHIRDSIRV